jgi:hypothetical protein
MSLAIHTTAGNHAGPRSKRGLEIYPTPPCAVEALIRAEPLPPACWEACGTENSAIAQVLRAHDHRVVCTDITIDGVDFRDRTTAPPDVQAIVTNSPFSLAADVVRHGLTLVPKVVILQRIQFLESDVRADLFDAGKLVRIFVFRDRVPRMHLAGWEGNRAEPAMFLAWFTFSVDHDGSKPVLDWIRCKPSKIRCKPRAAGTFEIRRPYRRTSNAKLKA